MSVGRVALVVGLCSTIPATTVASTVVSTTTPVPTSTTAGALSALNVLASIPIALEHPDGYDRDRFQYPGDLDGDGELTWGELSDGIRTAGSTLPALGSDSATAAGGGGNGSLGEDLDVHLLAAHRERVAEVERLGVVGGDGEEVAATSAGCGLRPSGVQAASEAAS